MNAGTESVNHRRPGIALKNVVRAVIGRKRAKIGWHALYDQSYRFTITQRTRFYIHIPKTAGSSILQWCRNEGVPVIVIGHDDRHPGFKGAGDWLDRDDADAFCVVRNPFDRLFSAYRYLVRGGNRESDRLDYERLLSSYADFRTFILEGLGGHQREDILRQVHLRPQIEWIRGEQGIAVGHVLRYEQLQVDFDELFGSWGFKTSILPEINRASGATSGYQSRYVYNGSVCTDMIDVVTSTYKEDFEFFGYETHL
jgi:hypothetical protein